MYEGFFCCMSLLQPPLLVQGDGIHLVATARYVTQDLIDQTCATIEKAGFRPLLGQYMLCRAHQFAGTDEQRAEDLQVALDHPSSRAVLAMRGGYGTQRILDKLDFTKLQSDPKWVCGFSDITALHGHLQNLGVQSLHCAMPSVFPTSDPEAVQGIFEVLQQGPSPISWATNSPELEISGRLVGGNLSVLQTMVGSPSFPEMEGSILFLEDLDEMLYHIDRMMIHLQRAGSLDNLNGVVLGGMTDMRDNTIAHGFSSNDPFGASAEDTVQRICRQVGIPCVTGLPAGHIERNLPLVLGSEVQLRVFQGRAELSPS